MSPLRTAPVTAECLIVCSALFVICSARTIDAGRLVPVDKWGRSLDPSWVGLADQVRTVFTGIHFRDAQRQWGALLSLHVVPDPDEPPRAIHRELVGPFDLWDGQWWRIPASSFHHVNFVHLIFNCLSGWALGRRLERRWGSLRYALFLVPAILVPLLVETLIGHSAMGFSGAICAMLGALIVLQGCDPRDDDIPDEAITATLGLLLLGIPATALCVIEIANAAHVSGVVYGWLAAWIFCGSGRRVRYARTGFLAAHGLLLPAVWLAVHPAGNGRYLWYVAERDAQIAPLEYEPRIRRAVKADPSLTGIWLRLAAHRRIEGNLLGAWNVLIEGLSHNPADADLLEETRRVWRRLPYGPDRDIAQAELQRVFGERSGVWSEQIRQTRLAAAIPSTAREPAIDPRDFPLDKPIDLQWAPAPAQHPPPQLDPDRPDSAAEGKPL